MIIDEAIKQYNAITELICESKAALKELVYEVKIIRDSGGRCAVREGTIEKLRREIELAIEGKRDLEIAIEIHKAIN